MTVITAIGNIDDLKKRTSINSIQMKKYILLITIITLLSACTDKQAKPQSGTDWGVIPNPSAEMVQSSVVDSWQTDRGTEALCFYSNIAYAGSKSLAISSNTFAAGRWFTKVNLKPWSKYRFTGYIKTEALVAERGQGASYRINGFDIEPLTFEGDNEWTLVEYVFETGNDDSAIIECLFAARGRSKGKVWFDNLNLDLISSEKIETSFTVDMSSPGVPMEKYIYGQFIEHLGKCIYGGIWAEMIQDRKFWFPVDTRESPWKVNGKKEGVTMDGRDSFVGEHSPLIQFSNDEQVSVYQSALGLRKDISYSGHLVIKGSGQIDKVIVSLGWGDTEAEKVKVEITGVESEYRSFPLKFLSNIETGDATISIEPIGNGKLWIGTISLMPDDNISGFRADVMQLLKELDSPVYRWPGGNFVSGYNWKDGIGDRDKRPPRKNPAWQGVEHNDVGIHEFMEFCRLLNTEAYIAVNAGLGNAEEARQEVEYLNGSLTTPMGKLRALNGKAEPWMVKWWSIGNEMYGGWQLGFMTTEQFVEKHNEFAKVMRSVDSTIKLIAVGEVGRWDRMILANCADNMDLISEHFYRQDWHGGGLMTHVKQIPDAIRGKAEAHRAYREEIPGLADKDIRICMDEWNYWYGPHIYGELGTRYFMRDALGIAAGINEFSRNSDIIFMANYAQTVNVIGAIKTSTTSSVMAATGQALKMYRKHFGTLPVSISGETRPFDVAATLNEKGDTLMISIVNATWDSHKFKMDIVGGINAGSVEIYTLTGPDEMSFNTPGEEMNVLIMGPETRAMSSYYKVEPFTATIFRIPVTIN